MSENCENCGRMIGHRDDDCPFASPVECALDEAETQIAGIEATVRAYLPPPLGGECPIQAAGMLLAQMRRERDEAQEALESLESSILEELPYKYDDGEDDDADPWECIGYAAQEIRTLKRERDEARAEVESLRGQLARLRAWATGERPGEGNL